MLEDRGYTVLVAETAAAAIDLAERHPGPIHLVLADIVMPGMSGPEAAARLVALRPDTRVLYTSGYPGGATGRRNQLPPSAQLLGKPFTQQALLGKVREVLDAPPRAAS
jgi:two-component system cell cycle sensor histidine kinase/response regulator CckA